MVVTTVLSEGSGLSGTFPSLGAYFNEDVMEDLHLRFRAPTYQSLQARLLNGN